MTLDELYQIILSRKKEMPENSYVASLFYDGGDRIIQKVGEEAVEVVIAAKNEGKKRIISEVADLFFHLFVLLIARGITVSDILEELERRHNMKSVRSEEHTSELQSPDHLVCRLLLEKKKKKNI